MFVTRQSLGLIPDAVLHPLIGDSFFKSRGFAESWRAMGGRPTAWTASIDGTVAGILPGVEFHRGPYVRFESMPDGCYGGPLVHPDLAGMRPAIVAAIFDRVRRHGYARTHVFDFEGAMPRVRGFDVERCETTIVDTSGPAWAPADKKLQSEIRKAAREGIRVEPFAWERHGSDFMRLAALAARQRGGRLRYPERFFRTLATLARRDDRILWVWCAHQGEPACSHIYFVENGMVQAWQWYCDRRFSFLKPNQYIQFRVASQLAERGVTRLNLGATPPSASGVAHYKDRWGGARAVYACHVRDVIGRLLHPIRSRRHLGMELVPRHAALNVSRR